MRAPCWNATQKLGLNFHRAVYCIPHLSSIYQECDVYSFSTLLTTSRIYRVVASHRHHKAGSRTRMLAELSAKRALNSQSLRPSDCVAFLNNSRSISGERTVKSSSGNRPSSGSGRLLAEKAPNMLRGRCSHRSRGVWDRSCRSCRKAKQSHEASNAGTAGGLIQDGEEVRGPRVRDQEEQDVDPMPLVARQNSQPIHTRRTGLVASETSLGTCGATL